MSDQQGVLIQYRAFSGVDGFITVKAQVDGGVTGEYLIATDIVGTPREKEEILAQSASRLQDIEAAHPEGI